MKLAAIVLAAGKGSRFGGDKMAALLDGEPLVRHAIRAARAAPVERVVVVCPSHLDLGDWQTEPAVGAVRIDSDALSASLKAGIAATSDAEGAFVFLGDMPLVPHNVAQQLADILADNFAAVPRHAGRNGHPVLLSSRAFPAIAALAGDEGAGKLLKARKDIAFLDVSDEAVLLDVDRAEDLVRMAAREKTKFRENTVTDFSGLFTPFQLGKFTLPNRFVFPPMGLEVCEGGIPGDDAAEYYARRAQGGASLVITEGAYIDHPSSGDNPLLGRFHGEDAYEAWRNVATKVHREGGICFPELWHVGLIPSGPDLLAGKGIVFRPELGQVSPSGYIAPGNKVTDGMSQAQIDDVINAYAVSTAKAVELGFDGIELHGAHGYVIDQFLWKELNHRTDSYGGSARARGQFAAEVIRACREQLEPGMPIIMRMSFWKMADFNARLADTPQELEELLAPIVEAGIELFDCSQRRFWEPTFDDGSDLNLAGWVKKMTGVPTCTIGSIGLELDFLASLSDADAKAELDLGRLDELMRRFDRGDFDLVAVGRAMIAEPDWPKLVHAGRFDQLKPFATSLMADPLMAHVKN